MGGGVRIHRKNSFTHSTTAQPTYVMPDGCDCACGDNMDGDDEVMEGTRGRSDGAVFFLGSPVVESWTLGSTQCSNTRMFTIR